MFTIHFIYQDLQRGSALGTLHQSRSREREAPTCRRKDKEKMGNLMTTNIRQNQRRTMERQRKIPGSGVNSIRAPDITLLISTQSSHWWLR
jgi:hypothetical protein